MKSLLILLALPVFAQNALWVDLSGDWRSFRRENRPEFAARNFDDSAWGTTRMPLSGRWENGTMWLRRTVELPDGIDQSHLALTLGFGFDAFDVYVNGERIGSTGGYSHWEAEIPRPRTFAIPRLAADSRKMVIAVRGEVFGISRLSAFRIPPQGPFLITYLAHAPFNAGASHLDDLRISYTPDLVLGVLFLSLALLLVSAWTTDTRRGEILWLALCLALRACRGIYTWQTLAEASHPSRWAVAVILDSSLETACLTVFAAIVAGFAQRGVQAAILLLWSVFPLSIVAGFPTSFAFGPVNRSLCVVAIVLILVGWLRPRAFSRMPERSLGRSTTAIALLMAAFLQAPQFRGWLGLPQRWDVGRFHVLPSDGMFLVLASIIAVQIVLRLAADRRESQRLASELEAARSIQQILLPPQVPGAAVFDVEAVYEPAQEVGGDLHWTRFVADGSLIVVVGDVSGKGLKAAMLVSVAVGILRNEKSASPGAILNALNEGLVGQAGGGFVTCCCARFDPDGTVTVANAGHPAPYCDGREVEVEAGLPLGVAAGVEYAESVTRGARFTFVSRRGVVSSEREGRAVRLRPHTRDQRPACARDRRCGPRLGPERRHHRGHRAKA